MFCRITFKSWLNPDSLIKLCDRISPRQAICWFPKRGNGGGLWVQLVGYGARSPVGVSEASRRIALEEDRACTLQHNFSLQRGFCKFCVECQRYVKEI
ncbi:hypothetical protein QUA13_12975 [Microcoleus sp. S28C3]|uniref:hypothetical protein n=1 Tax=Microcoleus sp. S28C3 TaxID=3055414 RepID=UPI002FD69B3D